MYILDTNLYIRAFRNKQDATALDAFYMNHMPRTYMSAVVVHELVVGAQTRTRQSELESKIVAPFMIRDRIITPSYKTWVRSGEVYNAILKHGGYAASAEQKGFFNDLLVAASCRENGITLVTDNLRDFEIIRKFLVFKYVSPWP